MKEKVKILVVDDHPIICKAYMHFLKEAEKDYIFEVTQASSCDEVLNKFRKNSNSPYSVVLLDLNIPASMDNRFIDGQDLGKHLKKRLPNIKLIIHTALSDQNRISNIVKDLKPDGFLIKTDIEPNVLLEAVHTVLQDNTYYSESTNKFLSSFNVSYIHVDTIDRKILYLLSIGEKMKHLPNYIPMSMASIERKKKNLHIMLGTIDGSKKELLKEAKAHGLI